MNLELLNSYTRYFVTKLKEKFITKEESINGILLEQGWELVNSSEMNSPIELPDLDTFNELYIEMYSPSGTIVHNTTLRKDSLLFESTNTEIREILIDSIHDSQTFVTYNIFDNTIIPFCFEGELIDESSDVITSVFVKGTERVSTFPASKVAYDGKESGLESNSVQGAIDEHTEKSVSSENGAHGFRYFEGKLQAHIYDEESMTLKWVTVPGSGIAYDSEKSVQGAIDELKGTIGYAKKNLLKNINITSAQTKNGVTCTPNADGSFTLKGTATAQTFFNINYNEK